MHLCMHMCPIGRPVRKMLLIYVRFIGNFKVLTHSLTHLTHSFQCCLIGIIK